MKETVNRLQGDFVVLDLGSAHTLGLLREVPGLSRAITFIEVDALLREGPQPAPEANRICLRKAVAGKRGKRVFKQRKFPECSSFLEPVPEAVAAYGLQDYVVEVGALELECETIAELLGERGIQRVDLFKTEHLQQQAAAELPEPFREELARFVEPRFSLPRFVLSQVNKLPMGWMLIGAACRRVRYGGPTTALYPDPVLGGIDWF